MGLVNIWCGHTGRFSTEKADFKYFFHLFHVLYYSSTADSSTSFVRHLFSPVIIKAINLKFNSKRHLNTQDLTAQSMLNPQEEKVPPKKTKYKPNTMKRYET